MLTRLRLRRLRRIARGYRALRSSGRLGLIADTKTALTTARIPRIEGRASAAIFGVAVGDAERVTRQYLLRRLAGHDLNTALLHALGRPGGRVVHPLPAEWRRALRTCGFDVAGVRSAALWTGYLALVLGYGLLVAAKLALANLRACIQPPADPAGPFVYFDGLTLGNLPQPGPDGRSHDIVSWYQQWPGRVAGPTRLCHNARGGGRRVSNGEPVVEVPFAVLPLNQAGQVARVAWGWGVAVIRAAVDLLRGRWWHALLFSEAVTAIQMRHQSAQRVAREYLFHNSNWAYRPIWTYEAEARGALVTFYFYSTNVEGFQDPAGNTRVLYGWQAITWPRYLVWDADLAAFVRRFGAPDADIFIVGPIWFHTSAEAMCEVGPRAIAAFDVTPFRYSRHMALGIDRDFYVPAVSVAWLRDVHAAARRCGGTMVWKQKRRIGANAHPHYRHVGERLADASGVVLVSPDVSAVRVIEASAAVISMPFTSTALVARQMGKPSCYYDPLGQLCLGDRGAHGLPIIQGPDALVEWVERHVGPSGEAR